MDHGGQGAGRYLDFLAFSAKNSTSDRLHDMCTKLDVFRSTIMT